MQSNDQISMDIHESKLI